MNDFNMSDSRKNQSTVIETNFQKKTMPQKNWLHSMKIDDRYALCYMQPTTATNAITTITNTITTAPQLSAMQYSSGQSQINRQRSVIRSTSPKLSTVNHTHNVTTNMSSMTIPGPKKGGRFRPNWLIQFEWLRYDQSKDIMYCMFCRRWLNDIPDIRTSFAEGSSNFRLEILNHHDRCKAHKVCTEREMHFRRMHESDQFEETDQHQ